MFKTCITRSFSNKLGDDAVKNNLSKSLSLIHEIFLQHTTATDHVVLLLHCLTILYLRQLSSEISCHLFFNVLIR